MTSSDVTFPTACLRMVNSAIFGLRSLGGKWKSMRVIETEPHALSPAPPEAPCIEREV